MTDASMSCGFPPIAAADARLLLLGSLPGAASLAAQQYYAHPQNAFWAIMAEIAAARGDYASRCAALKTAGIAVWDVLHSAARRGSLDAAIDMQSAAPNDFRALFAAHRHIELIAFNGAKAEQLYRRFVAVQPGMPAIRSIRLPSSSPAYAAMSRTGKLAAWRRGIAPIIAGH